MMRMELLVWICNGNYKKKKENAIKKDFSVFGTHNISTTNNYDKKESNFFDYRQKQPKQAFFY